MKKNQIILMNFFIKNMKLNNLIVKHFINQIIQDFKLKKYVQLLSRIKILDVIHQVLYKQFNLKAIIMIQL